jgi:cob(I)alamin adenosyltransferase
MEVKVQYITELNKVLNEIRRLLPTSMDWTYELNTTSTFLDRGQVEVAASIIDATRQSMYQVDQRLADCQAMLGGYLSTTSPANNQNVDLEKLNEMNEKLQSVASMLQPQEDTDGTTS